MKAYRTFRAGSARPDVPERAGKALLAGLALGAVLALGAGWFLMRGAARTEPVLPPVSSPPAAGPSEVPEPLDEPASPREPVALGPTQKAESAQDQASARPAAGTLTVRARLASGGAPEVWMLDLEDVGLLVRAPADARTTVRVDGPEIVLERRIDTQHLLRGRAAGLSSRAHGVTLLVKRPTAVVELVLETAAVVEGRVVDAEDQPVAARGVWLMPWLDSKDPGEPPLPVYARTQATGDFRFVDVRPGKWIVAIGERVSPLVRMPEVLVTLPVTRLDTIRLPPMFTLALRAQDEHGLAVADARLWSRGSNGGAFDVAADAYGEARVSELPAGRWRVFAQSPTRGRANLVIELPRANADEAVVLKLRAPD